MDAHEFDSIKIEKLKAMRRYNTFKKIATIVKTVEIFVAILFISFSISWSSSYIPIAVHFSTAFLRRFFSLLFSPHFVFVIGNAIVITLFAKSSSESSSVSSSESFSGQSAAPVEERETEKVIVPAEEEERETEKVIVPEEEEERETKKAIVIVPVEEEERETEKEKSYRRSKSTVEMVVVKEKELRRSVTEPRRKVKKVESPAKETMRMFEEDDLTGEEFRRKVEAFIEKQQKFLREESKTVVLSK